MEKRKRRKSGDTLMTASVVVVMETNLPKIENIHLMLIGTRETHILLSHKVTWVPSP